ncbi:MAG: radical SAM protein [Candidatus Lokiarchaeota archaeon]|nr:radical SAM protein [Candidatus Lokiarchaeota archaeon]
MRYECIIAKSILSKQKGVDHWFNSRHSMNAYRGCEFGCVYCDGMSESYHVDNFLTHIRVKENAPEIVRKELESMGFSSRSKMETESLIPFLDSDDIKRLQNDSPPKFIIGVSGGVSDAYQQAEKKYKVTRKILEVMLDFEIPIFLLTKSNLVLRDLDLLKEIHERSLVNVAFTVTLMDDGVKKVFEPKSSTTNERFNALKEIREAGLHGGIAAMPLIPGISDTQENMRKLAEATKKAKGEYILWGGLTLKPGRQKDYFMSVLRKRFSEKRPLIERIYQNEDPYGAPAYKLLPVNVIKEGYHLCNKLGIDYRIPLWPIHGVPQINQVIIETLLRISFHIKYINQQPWYRAKPYDSAIWLIENNIEGEITLDILPQIAERLKLDQRAVSVIGDVLKTGESNLLQSFIVKL